MQRPLVTEQHTKGLFLFLQGREGGQVFFVPNGDGLFVPIPPIGEISVGLWQPEQAIPPSSVAAFNGENGEKSLPNS